MKRLNNTRTMVISAMFLAIAFVLPFFTGQIQQIGSMLCPMHLPVLLCGFLCGPSWGCIVGFVAPLLRSLVLGMPPMFPQAVCMALELATYGLLAGVFYKMLPEKKVNVYLALILSMIGGRVVWGIAMLLCMGISGAQFTFQAFITGAITNAIPGIVIQLVLIPVLVMAINKSKDKE